MELWGGAQILNSENKDDKLKEYINDITMSSQNLLHIVNDILDFSKLDSGNFGVENKAFDLNLFIKQIKNMMYNLVGDKSIKLSFDIDTKLPDWIESDPVRLQQILTNLIGNAIKFTEKGSVNLTVKVNSFNHGLYDISFIVEDTGIGISRKDFSKLFNEFSQIDEGNSRNFGGTGLGLSISKKLAKLLNGDIYFESELNKGSIFTFRFSVLEASSIETDSLDDETQDSFFSDYNVLVVDDNLINMKVASKFLSAVGVNVIEAKNGVEALELLDVNQVDLIFMDCHMPVMDGYTATKNIIAKYSYRRPPIIALTASSMQEDIEKCYNAGMDDFISKPLNKEVMYNSLKKYFTKSAKVNES